MREIIHYLDEAENDLYQDWLDSLRDRVAKLAIIKRVARMEVGLVTGDRPRFPILNKPCPSHEGQGFLLFQERK